jgi:hypothetical protein
MKIIKKIQTESIKYTSQAASGATLIMVGHVLGHAIIMSQNGTE